MCNLSIAAILLPVMGILLVPNSSIQSSTIWPDKNLCRESDGSMYCCSGYYETQNGCQECVGSIGFNCSVPCPPEYFGPRCASYCQCAKDECDAKFGCSMDKETTSLDISTASQTGSTSDRNFFQRLSLTNWVLIFSTAFVMACVVIGGAIFFRNETKRKKIYSQSNDIKENNSTISLSDYENVSSRLKLQSSGYI